MPRSKKGKDDESKKNGEPKKPTSSLPVVSKSEKAVIEELLRSAFTEYSLKYDVKKLERAETAQRLTAFISEFLSAYMIIGYDMQGAPLNIIHATNQMDADALSAALNKLIFNLNNMDE